MTHGKRTERGFTLIELMVVVLIVGILAALSIPQYSKTVETAKADDAAATVKSLASAGRMFKLDHGNYVTDGVIDDSCNSKCCFGDTNPVCAQTEFDVCQLVACNYLGSAKYSTQAYAFRRNQGHLLRRNSEVQGRCLQVDGRVEIALRFDRHGLPSQRPIVSREHIDMAEGHRLPGQFRD